MTFVSCCRLYLVIACSAYSHYSRCRLGVSLLSFRGLQTCRVGVNILPRIVTCHQLEVPNFHFSSYFPSSYAFSFFLVFLLLVCCDVRLLSSLLPAGQINTNCNLDNIGGLVLGSRSEQTNYSTCQISNINGAVVFAFLPRCSLHSILGLSWALLAKNPSLSCMFKM